jgi:hypothetical protein
VEEKGSGTAKKASWPRNSGVEVGLWNSWIYHRNGEEIAQDCNQIIGGWTKSSTGHKRWRAGSLAKVPEQEKRNSEYNILASGVVTLLERYISQ